MQKRKRKRKRKRKQKRKRRRKRSVRVLATLLESAFPGDDKGFADNSAVLTRLKVPFEIPYICTQLVIVLTEILERRNR